MKVSDGNSGRLTPLADKRREEQKRSERFSELLRNLEGKDPRRRRETNDSDSATAEANPLCVDGGAHPKPIPSSEMNFVSSQKTEAKRNPDINKLAAEIVGQFETTHADGKIQGLNLTFASEALAGLQVQIQQHQDSIAIRFVTDSEPLAKLLTQSTDQLRGTLSQKGIKVKGVVVSAQANNTLSRFAKQQTRERYAG